MAEYVVLKSSKSMTDEPVPYAALTHIDGTLTAYGDEGYMQMIRKAFEDDKEKQFLVDNPTDALRRRTTGMFSTNSYFEEGSDMSAFNNAVAQLGYEPQVVFHYEPSASGNEPSASEKPSSGVQRQEPNSLGMIDTSKFSSVRIVNNG